MVRAAERSSSRRPRYTGARLQVTRVRKVLSNGHRPEELERLIKRDGATKYPSFVSAVFDLHGKAQGKSSAGDKTPAYVRFIPAWSAREEGV